MARGARPHIHLRFMKYNGINAVVGALHDSIFNDANHVEESPDCHIFPLHLFQIWLGLYWRRMYSKTLNFTSPKCLSTPA